MRAVPSQFPCLKKRSVPSMRGALATKQSSLLAWLLDCFAYCSARTHSLHLFGDIVDTFWVTQIDRCDLMCGKEYSEPAIAAELANGEPLATEGLRDFPELSLETDIGLRGGDGANDLALVVFHHWKSIRHGAL